MPRWPKQIMALMGKIDVISGHPNFTMLCHIDKQWIVGDNKLKHCPWKYGHTVKIMIPDTYALLSTTMWHEPSNPKDHSLLGPNIKMENESCIKEQNHRAQDTVYFKFLNLYEAYRNILEIVIQKADQSGTTEFIHEVIGSDNAKRILAKIIFNYSNTQTEEILGKLKFLNNQFEINQPTEVLLCKIKDVQLFVMIITHKSWKLMEIKLIDQSVMNLKGMVT